MNNLILKAKTRKEIADEYGVDRKTLSKWLKMADIKIPPGIIKPIHQKIIYNAFGVPKIPNYPHIYS